MNRSRVLLLSLLGAILIYFAGEYVYTNYYAIPLKEATDAERDLGEEIQQQKRKIRIAQRRIEKIDEINRQSLPSSLQYARASYQEFLLLKMTQSGWQKPNVTVSSPKTTKSIARFTFTVSGKCSTRDLVSFLYEFYSSGHLHKIKQLSMNPVAGGQFLNVGLSIEALALTRSSNKNELGSEVGESLAIENLDGYLPIAIRNVFSSDGDKILRTITISGITSNRRGNKQVWFSYGNQQTEIVDVGGSFQVGSFEIKVEGVDRERAQIDLNGRKVSVRAGETIADAIANDAATATAQLNNKK